MRRKALKQKKIWNPALFGIRNPLSWNPESSNRNPESTGWNPESKTVMDSLTWGDNSLWLWRWLPHRWSKRQSLSTITVLFRTTFTRTIKLNLLLNINLVNKCSVLVYIYIELVRYPTIQSSDCKRTINQSVWFDLIWFDLECWTVFLSSYHKSFGYLKIL